MEQVFVASRDGANVRQLTTVGTNWAPAWSPDGKWVYHTAYKDEAFAIARTNVETGKTEQIHASETRVAAPDVRAAKAAPQND
jgi:Tol biopolymer transport system component